MANRSRPYFDLILSSAGNVFAIPVRAPPAAASLLALMHRAAGRVCRACDTAQTRPLRDLGATPAQHRLLICQCDGCRMQDVPTAVSAPRQFDRLLPHKSRASRPVPQSAVARHKSARDLAHSRRRCRCSCGNTVMHEADPRICPMAADRTRGLRSRAVSPSTAKLRDEHGCNTACGS